MPHSSNAARDVEIGRAVCMRLARARLAIIHASAWRRGAETCPKGKAQRMAEAWYERTSLVLSLLLRHIKLIACLCLLALLLSVDVDEVTLSSMTLSAISSALLCSALSAICR